MTTVEKPRLKLRDTFTTNAAAGGDGGAQEDGGSAATEFKEPIINERSQALREIIRHHEQGTVKTQLFISFHFKITQLPLFIIFQSDNGTSSSSGTAAAIA